MGPSSIFDRLRDWIGTVAWAVFLWSIKMTEDNYRKAIYEQEKCLGGEEGK